jgi:hypothetical protein
MDGHKEKEVWKEAEEAEARRDGSRRFGPRKAPFYKVGAFVQVYELTPDPHGHAYCCRRVLLWRHPARHGLLPHVSFVFGCQLN